MEHHPSVKFGGPGRSRTYGVSYVMDLQSTAIATMHTDPYGRVNNSKAVVSLQSAYADWQGRLDLNQRCGSQSPVP